MIEALIRRARRRYTGNEFLAQGAYAASAGMAAVILLLIAGTQILDWPFLVAVTGGTLAVGAYRIIHRLPSAYVIAQLIDRRLSLADTLSTALFFSRAGTKVSPSMRDGQRKQAEQVAERVELARALPFAMPRAMYALAVLGLIASSLFALRYGFTRTLDLRAPLTRIVMQNFGGAPQEEATLRKGAHKSRPDEPKPIGIALPEGDPNNPQSLDPASDSALDTVGVPDAVNDPLQKNQSQSSAKTESSGSEKAEGDQGDSETSDGADASSADSVQAAQNGKQANAPNAGKPESANPDANSSLMSKLRDAMSNLLSKMRQQNGNGAQRQASAGQHVQKPGTQRAGERQNGAPGAGQQQNNGQESADAQAQQAGAEGKDGKDSQAQAGGRSADQKGANQPGSGIGRQDGNKDTKLAEQVAAMGKISEIIGKRSASVTGEISVEVPSSQQKLQTPYSQSNATHSDAGGDLSRDEVPEILQQYVQQYFEQVRKQPSRKPETAERSKVQTPAVKTAPPSI